MLRSMNDLEGCAIQATDGDIGQVRDVYFDDQAWCVRYLVVDTGTWLSSRPVLVSPLAIGTPHWADKVLPAAMTRAQVKNSPSVDTDKPVSRQYEVRYADHYNYPQYWGGPELWGLAMSPSAVPGYGYFPSTPGTFRSESEKDYEQAQAALRAYVDPHLRSCKAIMGYHLHAVDGDLGHVRGFLLDEEDWSLRYLVVDASTWWYGRQVLIAPQWVQEVNWPHNRVSVNLSRQEVRDAPAYDASAAVDRAQEADIYRHYQRPGYWVDQKRR